MQNRRAIFFGAVFVFCIPLCSCKDNGSHLPLDSGSRASVALSGLSGCRTEVAALAAALREDELAVNVQDGKVRFTHRGAVFNCCLDSVSLELFRCDDILRVVETAHAKEPCRCECTFDLQGEIADLESGEYWLEVAASPEVDSAWCRVQIHVR